MSRLLDILNPAPSSSQLSSSGGREPCELQHGQNLQSPLLAAPLGALKIEQSSPSCESRPQKDREYISPQVQGDNGVTSATQHSSAPAFSKGFLLSNPPSSARSRKSSPLAGTPREREASAKRESAAVTPTRMDIESIPLETTSMTESSAQAAALSRDKGREQSKTPTTFGATEPASRASSVLPSTEEKKRAAPKKKPTASLIKKTASKKRKAESSSKDTTPVSQRSATPSSARFARNDDLKSKKGGSTTPQEPAEVEDEEDEADEDDDSELFCICRKPDDHTWMIGCDGGCEDWFHGRCVKMDEKDGKLIDKYICPNCVAKGHGQTTWKPMCRLESCREPARAFGPKPSKYCCDEHGELYMRQRVFNKASKDFKVGGVKRRRRDDQDEMIEVENDAEDEPAHLRGGLLKPAELKALVNGVDSIEKFKKLGDHVLAQAETKNGRLDDAPESQAFTYTAQEEEQLEKLASQKAELKQRREAFDDREKFLTLVRARARGLFEELKKKDKSMKDLCGFDSRLAWSDEQFDEWRQTEEGRAELGGNKAPAASGDGDIEMGDANDESDSSGLHWMCQKKRCERHKQWFKLHHQEVAFERQECRREEGKLEKEENGIRERAMLRGHDQGD